MYKRHIILQVTKVYQGDARLLRSYPDLLSTIAKIRLYRVAGYPQALPFNYTFSVTNECNSHCMTCRIWDSKVIPLMTPSQYITMFRSIGKSPFFVTISGGEPTLRSDLPEIVKSLCDICEPNTVTIPTNGINPTKSFPILEKIVKENSKVTFKINISLDGIGSKHDHIRQTEGNFKRAVALYEHLVSLSKTNKNLITGYYTVLSKFNYRDLNEILDFINTVKPQSYGFEPAQYRPIEMNNNPDLLPDNDTVIRTIDLAIPKLEAYLNSLPNSPPLRGAYYEFVNKVLKNNKMPLTCYAGFSSIHISPMGWVWSCCTGQNRLGNLRETDWNLAKLLRNNYELIKSIHQTKCSCMMSNAFFSSYMSNFSNMVPFLLEKIHL